MFLISNRASVSGSRFPAYAGMFRASYPGPRVLSSFPRIRGDVPDASSGRTNEPVFSPHTRGCSCDATLGASEAEVFPAYAGMFLRSVNIPRAVICFPRIRGDVPTDKSKVLLYQVFSPHTRGCSFFAKSFEDATEVFPAYAGMFRLLTYQHSAADGFPRIRGDVPLLLGRLVP